MNRIESILSRNIEAGSLEIHSRWFPPFRLTGKLLGPKASIEINNFKALFNIAMKADIGLGESYIKKHIEVKDVASFIEFACRNEKKLTSLFKGNLFFETLYSAIHKLKKNTIFQSKKNIQKHYDLGNEFYQLWLDNTMTYSSGLFHPEIMTKENFIDEDLENAQVLKYDRIIEKLAIQPSHTILEIGCGWGGFIARAENRTGCSVEGITLSEQQFAYVNERIEQDKLKSQVQLVDYRQKEGLYDRVVSIEMIEAVGIEFWESYFQKISQSLKPNGQALIQGITIKDEAFESYSKSSDFIKAFIFPGGCLVAPARMQEIALKQGLKLESEYYFGQSYAHTLKIWRERFEKKKSEIIKQGFNESFIRMWKFYLEFCEGAFRAEKINVAHFHLVKID